MTKKEYALNSVNWKIEDAYKEIKEAQQRLKAESESSPEMINPTALQNATIKITENQEKLRRLFETKKIIEMLTEEEAAL